MRNDSARPVTREPVEIRDATRADLLSVHRIERAVFDQPWPYDAFESSLSAPAFLVAERTQPPSDGPERTGDHEESNYADGGVGRSERSERPADRSESEPADERGTLGTPVVGYVVGDRTATRGVGHVKDLAVHPEAQRSGIGRRLLRAGLERFARGGADSVKLEVRASNEAARALYRSEGFHPARRVPGYYRDGETAVVMTVNLREWVHARR